MSIEVKLMVTGTVNGKPVNKALLLPANKSTDEYEKFAVGERGAEVIATAYIHKTLLGEAVKGKKKGKAEAKVTMQDRMGAIEKALAQLAKAKSK